MRKEYDLKEGLEEAILKLKKIEERPLLAAVYGWPNSGKSYLIRGIGDYFEEEGFSTAQGSGGPTPITFQLISEHPLCRGDILFLFHCAWERNDYVSLHEDPNVLAERICGRKVHLNIGIYNPRFFPPIEGNYDLVITNTGSVRKLSL